MKVIMRHEARIRFREILAEGERRFGSRVASQLYEAYMHNMALLAENPYMGPLEPLLDRRSRSYRYLCIHKYYKVIYHVRNEEEIIVSDVWDTRREPRRLVEGLID